MPEIVAETLTAAASSAGGGDVINLFGRYELGKLLGCGASAKVYHARDTRTGQSMAVKAISKKNILKGDLTAHVKREISIMRRMRHPNIMRLHEVLATKSKIYFVMDFAKGGELFARVSKGRFSEDLSRRYFQQLISAVKYCHSHGVYHRDLKPENLLLDENWNLKITDFGLSAVAKDQVRPDGLLHTLCGTPAYVAPEILAKKGYEGSKVDVWSCGVTLFVLNAGYLPFNDPNLMVMYRKIYKGEFRCPKWTSPELKTLLSKLLDVNPETRITIDEIMKDPWFNKGYKEAENFNKDFQLFDAGDYGKKCLTLNAFDIISFSSGFDLSGLFNSNGVSDERFVSRERPEKIIERVEEVGRKEGVRVVKGVNGMKLEGKQGQLLGVVEINRLTEKLVVVEVKRRENGGVELWKDKLRPQLGGLIYRPEAKEQIANGG